MFQLMLPAEMLELKGHGKTQGGHLEVLHTTLKCYEDFEFFHMPRLPESSSSSDL